MDVIGIGGPEFILLLLLGAVVLGPRRVIGLARDIGQVFRQIQSMTKNLSKEINREFDLLNVNERREAGQTPGTESHTHNNGNEPGKLPEAYTQFREDFPEEGGVDSIPNPESQDISPDL
jgi:Sec-independent protein translocase protein TatA